MRSSPRVHGRAALALSLALALGGCGDGAEEPELIDRELATLVPDDVPSAPSPSAGPGSSSGRPTPSVTSEPGAVAARAARSAVRGGTVTVVERIDSDWEVTLVGQDGRETVVAVNQGGPSVVRRLSVDDADDRAEAQRLVTGARLDVARAIARARTVVPEATVIKVELDEDDGVTRYELDFDDEDDVFVDARTGALSRDD